MGKIKLVLGASILLLVSAQANAYLDQSGRDWIDDLEYIVGFSRNDIASVCNTVSGECSGLLDASLSASLCCRPNSDIDMAGLIWASSEDVEELFYEVAELPPGSLDSGLAYFPGSEMKGELIASVFANTFADFDILFFDGMTRNGSGFVLDYPFDLTMGEDEPDRFAIGGGAGEGELVGTWLYVDTSPVPAPAAIWLFGIGLIGLVGVSKQRKVV